MDPEHTSTPLVDEKTPESPAGVLMAPEVEDSGGVYFVAQLLGKKIWHVVYPPTSSHEQWGSEAQDKDPRVWVDEEAMKRWDDQTIKEIERRRNEPKEDKGKREESGEDEEKREESEEEKKKREEDIEYYDWISYLLADCQERYEREREEEREEERRRWIQERRRTI